MSNFLVLLSALCFAVVFAFTNYRQEGLIGFGLCVSLLVLTNKRWRLLEAMPNLVVEPYVAPEAEVAAEGPSPKLNKSFEVQRKVAEARGWSIYLTCTYEQAVAKVRKALSEFSYEPEEAPAVGWYYVVAPSLILGMWSATYRHYNGKGWSGSVVPGASDHNLSRALSYCHETLPEGSRFFSADTAIYYMYPCGLFEMTPTNLAEKAPDAT